MKRDTLVGVDEILLDSVATYKELKQRFRRKSRRAGYPVENSVATYKELKRVRLEDVVEIPDYDSVATYKELKQLKNIF